MKLCYIDVETTGLDFGHHEIIQISGIIEINGERKSAFDIKMRPNHPERCSEEMLEKTGLTLEQLETYPSRKEGFEKFISIMSQYVDRFDKNDKFHIVGYNCSFDRRFIDELFKEFDDPYVGSWFWFEAIDVLSMVMLAKMGGCYNGENLQLGTALKEFGIKVDETRLHDGLYDIALTYKLFHKIQDKINFTS